MKLASHSFIPTQGPSPPGAFPKAALGGPVGFTGTAQRCKKYKNTKKFEGRKNLIPNKQNTHMHIYIHIDLYKNLLYTNY